ncbi:MAG: hypothetical protein KatS3mg061_3365 [Dehalococcoidia bacterium]|nr:MAG: hypothetical protein KatS3mg061_3365 [Dehalococcoidia bacterium]
MDLALNEAQSLLARTARDFLAQECPLKLVRAMEEDPTGFPSALWKQLAELGWLGLALPEEVGGSGGDLVDLCVLLEEMGRALLPGPFLPAIVPVATTIARLGRPEQRQELLPAIIRGERIVTWAGQEPAARYDPPHGGNFSAGRARYARAPGDQAVCRLRLRCQCLLGGRTRWSRVQPSAGGKPLARGRDNRARGGGPQ